jgi:hypothetical protein
MRIILLQKDRDQLFQSVHKVAKSYFEVSKSLGISTKTLSNWRLGKATIPEKAFYQLLALANMRKRDIRYKSIDDWWNNSAAGRRGGKTRMAKYGQLGDIESRRRGGQNSYEARKGDPVDIFSVANITIPQKSKLLAEFVGIILGDGSLTKYQVTISNNLSDDYEYSMYISCAITKLFGIQPSTYKRHSKNCVLVNVSSIRLVEHLKSLGVPQGNKIKQGVDMPQWILEEQNYKSMCLRGLFDTDGCIFQENHTINGKIYSYPMLSFVSASKNLRHSIKKSLEGMDFSPKIRNNRSVNLESKADIKRYFKIIGTSNPKHLSRYRQFLGGVG